MARATSSRQRPPPRCYALAVLLVFSGLVGLSAGQGTVEVPPGLRPLAPRQVTKLVSGDHICSLHDVCCGLESSFQSAVTMGWTPAPLVPMPPGPAVAPMARRVCVPSLVSCCRCSFAARIITHQFSCPPLRCSLVNSVATNTSGPVVASAGSGKECPYPALYAVFSLPNICSDRAFNAVRAKFTAALAAAAGPGGEGEGF